MFGRKKKAEGGSASNLEAYEKKLEILNKNIDLNKLTKEIEKFINSPKNPLDFSTYTIHDFPEQKLS